MDGGEKVVEPGAWNRYQILAVGHCMWATVKGIIGSQYGKRGIYYGNDRVNRQAA